MIIIAVPCITKTILPQVSLALVMLFKDNYLIINTPVKDISTLTNITRASLTKGRMFLLMHNSAMTILLTPHFGHKLIHT